MNIKPIQHTQNISKIRKITKNSTCNNTKSVECKSSIATSNYNISFFGLFNRKSSNQYEEARDLFTPVDMHPNLEYLISNKSVFAIDDYIVNLNADGIREHIDTLKKGDSIIFGREPFYLQNTPNYPSRGQLKVSRTKDGKLTACDIGSINRSKILPNFAIPKPFKMKPNIPYLLPKNSVINLANITNLDLSLFAKQINSLRHGQKLIAGSDPSSDIIINHPLISRNHVSIAKNGNNVVITDLNSTNGTFFLGVPLPNITYTDDFANIREIKSLRRGVRTRVQKNSQLYLGTNFTIDLRNKNILNLLEEKGRLTIGRHPSNDIVVPEFYDCVSWRHLELYKEDDDIIAVDTNSISATQVIPKNKIKAFNGGAANIELSQSNINDCYLLSAIYSLSRSEKGQEMLENMVSVDDNGNYIVKFYNKPPIIITPEELDGQKYGDKEKRSVSGDLGVKAIERAYAKALNWFNDKKSMFMKIDHGGNAAKAIHDLTGANAKYQNLAEVNVPALLRILYGNNIKNYALACSTPLKSNYCSYIDPEKRFNSAHCYSIKDINCNNTTVEIVNPFNTKKSEIISWKDFENIFSYIYFAKL